MSRDLNVTDKSGIAPNAERVIGEAAGANDLAVAGAPSETGDLRAGVDAVHSGTRGGVPEVDMTVVGAATSRKQVHVPGAPGEGLDSGLVVGLGELGDSQRSSIPDGNEVVIASGSELGTIGSPLKSTDLRRVGNELSNLVLSDTNVMVIDEAASGAGGKKVLVPAHNTNTGVVAEHATDLHALGNIPDLHLTGSKTNTDVGTIARPLNAANIGVWGGLQQAAYRAFIGRPDIDVALQTDGNLVTRAPVEQVQVVVINQTRSVKHTLGGGGNAASELSRASIGRLQRSVVLLSKINRLRRLRRRRLELEDARVEVDTASSCQGVLVSHGVGGRARVVRRIIVVDVQAFESSDSIIRGRRENVRAIAAAGLGSLLVLDIDLARAHISDSRAVAAVRNESVGSIGKGSLVRLGS